MFDPSVQRPPTQGAWSLNRFCAARYVGPCDAASSSLAPMGFAQPRATAWRIRDGSNSCPRCAHALLIPSHAMRRSVLHSSLAHKSQAAVWAGRREPGLVPRLRHYSPEPRAWRTRGRRQNAQAARDASTHVIPRTRCPAFNSRALIRGSRLGRSLRARLGAASSSSLQSRTTAWRVQRAPIAQDVSVLFSFRAT
ncbi:hypothetical protein BKA93DRAFT_762669, partial [Sparassis latifolia]